MAIPYWSWYHYHTVVHADRDGGWSGIAEDDGELSLLDSGPSVVVTNGRVTMTRRAPATPEGSSTASASFDGGDALAAVLREGDRLECWRTATADIGMSVTRAGSLVLGLGALGRAPGRDITIDHDPRVEETQLAREVRYIDRPGTRFVWLDPDRPSELEAGLRAIDGDATGVNLLAIVVRSVDTKITRELHLRTMGRPRPDIRASAFLTVAARFSSVEEWLQYARGLSPERPSDLWLRIRTGSHESRVPEGTTATVDGWLVHVFRVHEPGLPGQMSQLGLVAADSGVTAAMLERSSMTIDTGLTMVEPRSPRH